MPRGPGGTYELPPKNPVAPETTIESDWANTTMSDIKGALTDSLSRSAKGGMLGPLRGLDGSAAVPTFSFTNEPSSGRYRDGPGQVVESILGQPVVRYLATGLEQWDSDSMSWVPLTPRDAAGTPFDPAPSNLTSTNVQDAIEEVNDKVGGGTITADAVSYDDSAVYIAATTVQQAIDILADDLSGVANDLFLLDGRVQIVEGEYILLENRVANNETDILTNRNEIALNDTEIANLRIDVDNSSGDISSIQLEQQVQNSDITQNTTYIDTVYAITQTNADDISDNNNDIAQNASDISQNASDISGNTFNIAVLSARYTGGVLEVAHGGTGVTSKTGSGSVVLNNSPQLNSPTVATPTIDGGQFNNGDINACDLDNLCTAVTQGVANDTTRVATTAFVHALLDDEIQYESNANGNAIWFKTRSTMIQWGTRTGGSPLTVTFPVPFLNTVSTAVLIQQQGVNWWGNASAVDQLTTSSMRVHKEAGTFWWVAIGRFTG